MYRKPFARPLSRYSLARATLAAALAWPLAATAADWQALPDSPPVPADNPLTPAKIELGKQLYFDARLSIDGTVACASCHNVFEGGDDHRPTSVGVRGQIGGRNAPSVWNAAFLSAQFWDGRAASLEDQAKGPPTNPIEMGMASHEATAERVRKIPGYRSAFDAAFGAGSSIDMDAIVKAIASYERTLIAGNAAYDRFVRGDEDALTPAARRGMDLFAEVGCNACHSGANFAGPTLPAGVPFLQRFPTFTDSPFVARYQLDADTGRMASTGNATDAHLWRVPSLRNIALTAPYMHNGAVKQLDEAVRVMASTQLNRELQPQQVADLTAFLESLTGQFPTQTMPRLPATPGDLLD